MTFKLLSWFWNTWLKLEVDLIKLIYNLQTSNDGINIRPREAHGIHQLFFQLHSHTVYISTRSRYHHSVVTACCTLPLMTELLQCSISGLSVCFKDTGWLAFRYGHSLVSLEASVSDTNCQNTSCGSRQRGWEVRTQGAVGIERGQLQKCEG